MTRRHDIPATRRAFLGLAGGAAALGLAGGAPARAAKVATRARIVILGAGAAGIGISCGKGKTTKRPNVILLITDDQGYGDLGCYGNPDLRTPNLDRLYAESVRLANYHVDPMCSPTRAALQTGL